MFLVSSQRLQHWLGERLSPACVIENRVSLSSFQQYAERLSVRNEGALSDFVFRTYAAEFTLWPPFTTNVAGLVGSALLAAEQRSIAAPRVVARGELLSGVSAILTTWLPGTALSWPLTRDAIGQVAKALADLHAASPPANIPRYDTKDTLNELSKCAESVGSMDACSAISEIRAAGLGVAELVWVHGDAHPGNFVSNSCGDLSLIDWDESAIADYRYDVANFWGVVVCNQTAVAAEFFLERYAEYSGRTPTAIMAWWRLINTRDWLAVEWLKRAHAGGAIQVDISNCLSYQDAVYHGMTTKE